jgi:DNA-directed RNA polymerase subunit beta
MNVGQILETHLGWAARILGFYAKTPVFQGANEREIGLLLKLAGLTWVRDALSLRVAPLVVGEADTRAILADIRPDRSQGERVELLADAHLNDLSARGMSQETKDVFHRVRDFLAAAAKELAEREQTEVRNQLTFHSAGADDETLSAQRRAEFKSAHRQLEKRREDAAADCAWPPRHAGARGDALDASPRRTSTRPRWNCCGFAGITPGGKVRLRDGRVARRSRAR